MNVIDKDYFTLEEIESRWNLPRRDLAYLAENGILKLSLRVWDVCVENGYYETNPDGSDNTVPWSYHYISDLMDLQPRDVYRLFRDDRATIRCFIAPPGEYLRIIRPKEGLDVLVTDLVVRREERERVEAKQGIGPSSGPEDANFRQRNDYAEIHLAGQVFHLGAVQSRVVKLLHRATLAGDPWRVGKVLLRDAGSSCTRMADVFKSQRDWRRLIESDRRGNYRLRPPSK